MLVFFQSVECGREKLAFDEYLTLESTMVLHLQFYKTLICTGETEIREKLNTFKC